MNKDKVRGFFLGVAVGDSLGMPCEGWDAARIKETHGKITRYIDPKGHKYHDGLRGGTTTDDTQLTITVAEALIEAGGIDLDVQAKHHVKAFKSHTGGWGRTTREAIEKLANGVHWKDSGVFASTTDVKEGAKKPAPRGFGNGVAMKAGPIGIYLSTNEQPLGFFETTKSLADFTGMTHPTSMAVSSCFAHAYAVQQCMWATPENFSIQSFVTTIELISEIGKKYYADTLTDDDITTRFKMLGDPQMSPEEIIKMFGKGSYYVYDSLPFTYAFFIRNPTSIESLYECASAGGDTDSNASMLGSLLGTLNGTSIFPKELVDGLDKKNEIIKLADAFSEKFGI